MLGLMTEWEDIGRYCHQGLACFENGFLEGREAELRLSLSPLETDGEFDGDNWCFVPHIYLPIRFSRLSVESHGQHGKRFLNGRHLDPYELNWSFVIFISLNIHIESIVPFRDQCGTI